MSFFILAGEEGIEPPLTVLETAALPLYYSPVFLRWHRTNEGNYNIVTAVKASLFFIYYRANIRCLW